MLAKLVNNKIQIFSQKTQNLFHNDTNGFEMDTKALADYVTDVMNNDGLTSRDVERNSGNQITYSYVNKIKNGQVKNPSTTTLQYLARGLKRSEDEVFSVARGINKQTEDFEEKLKVAASGAENWSEDQKQRFISTVYTVAQGIRAERVKVNKE